MSLSTHRQDEVLPALLTEGRLDEQTVARATRLAEGEQFAHSIAYYLVKLEAIPSHALLEALTRHFRVRGIDLTQIEIDQGILGLIPPETIQQERVLPVAADAERKQLSIAMADPSDLAKIETVKFQTGYTIHAMIADEYSLEAEIEALFREDTDLREVLTTLEARGGDVSLLESVEEQSDQLINEEVEQVPVVQFINTTIQEAVKRRASDIHFEFYATTARVRFRIDGALLEVAGPSRRWERMLSARLKIMAHLDPTIRRVPQDGRIKIKVAERTIDLRVSTMPTNFGEKIVLRILDKGAVALDLDVLGFDRTDKQLLIDTIARPHGLVLATGPTGAGKTTTLYAIMALLNRPAVNIMTIEDPVEYDLPGVNQVTINPDVQMTFAAALRGFLRQDPDIIMVGEMRDAETAEIGLQAALTGHMVLSTMHTNNATEAVTRMLDLKLERFNIATATSLIIAQRLLRQVCAKCATATTPTPEQLQAAGLSASDAARISFRRGTGCRDCSHTGYRGRVGIYEMLRVTPEIADHILAGSATRDLQAAAMREGMRTLRMAGLDRVRQGLTTLEEVIHHTALA